MLDTIMDQLYDRFLQSDGVCTDTRTLKTNQLFFALSGPNFNGNRFAVAALEHGAMAVVIDEVSFYKENDAQYILVDDTLKALQNVAHHHRKQMNIPVLALTGSNGKTTTKELIKSVMEQTKNVLATRGNLNNHIGVPLTLLELQKSHEFMIIEMGANHQNEIAELCKIAAPNFGLITNVGKAHLEGFGGLQGVKKGKGEMFTYLEQAGGFGFVNSNDQNVLELAYYLPNAELYGSDDFGHLKGVVVSEKSPWTIRVNYLKWKDKINTDKFIDLHPAIYGQYNLDNILAAFLVGMHFKVPITDIVKGIESYQPSNQRSEVRTWRNKTLVLDAYNANPTSMAVAIEEFSQIESENKALILGEMKELGESSDREHKQLVRTLKNKDISKILLIGESYKPFVDENIAWFSDTAEVKIQLEELLQDCDYILAKGSRNNQLEQLFEET